MMESKSISNLLIHINELSDKIEMLLACDDDFSLDALSHLIEERHHLIQKEVDRHPKIILNHSLLELIEHFKASEQSNIELHRREFNRIARIISQLKCMNEYGVIERSSSHLGEMMEI